MRRLFLCAAALALCAGCQTKTFNIGVTPNDSIIKIDGEEKGQGHLAAQLAFSSNAPAHTVTVDRTGYGEGTLVVTPQSAADVHIDLKPEPHLLKIKVQPADAVVKIDNIAVTPGPVRETVQPLTFSLDERGAWNQHVVSAARDGFIPDSKTITWESGNECVLNLVPLKRTISVATTPGGADLFLDDLSHPIGTAPAQTEITFDFDARLNAFVPRRLIAQKAGWEPTTQPIAYEDTSTDHRIDLVSKNKVLHIVTDPPGGTVTLGTRELPRDEQGASFGKVQFPPINDQGDLPTYTAKARKDDPQREWTPQEFPIAWDNGQSDYVVKLKEVTTRPVEMLGVDVGRAATGEWEVSPRITTTIAKKSVAEGTGTEPVQIYQAPPGQTIDTLALSPDGTMLLFTILGGKDSSDFHSQILVKRADGVGDTSQINDGTSLDVMPSYTPNGDAIVFSSNRSGKTLSIWERNLQGIGGVVSLSGNRDEMDLWPGLDADPRTHLFYEARFDGQGQGHLYMATLNTTIRSELTPTSISQPRVSPKADMVAFVSMNEKSHKREIYRVPITGGSPELLAGSPEAENYDPAWSRDGSRLAFVSDRGVDEDQRANADIWILDLSKMGDPDRVTVNGSVDDCPVWDPSGSAIYFRSNRGGNWGIWKIVVKAG